MKFTKMHGAGNDYIYIDCFTQKVENPEILSKKLSDRHFGVGGDGIVLIKPSVTADCFMDIYNADGSRAQMCGNAVRCTAKYIFDNKIQNSTILVETLSGIKTVEIIKEDGLAVGGRVNMGKPILNGRQIPTRYGTSIVKQEKLNINNKDYEITCVSMGNPADYRRTECCSYQSGMPFRPSPVPHFRDPGPAHRSEPAAAGCCGLPGRNWLPHRTPLLRILSWRQN